MSLDGSEEETRTARFMDTMGDVGATLVNAAVRARSGIHFNTFEETVTAFQEKAAPNLNDTQKETLKKWGELAEKATNSRRDYHEALKGHDRGLIQSTKKRYEADREAFEKAINDAKAGDDLKLKHYAESFEKKMDSFQDKDVALGQLKDAFTLNPHDPLSKKDEGELLAILLFQLFALMAAAVAFGKDSSKSLYNSAFGAGNEDELDASQTSREGMGLGDDDELEAEPEPEPDDGLAGKGRRFADDDDDDEELESMREPKVRKQPQPEPKPEPRGVPRSQGDQQSTLGSVGASAGGAAANALKKPAVKAASTAGGSIGAGIGAVAGPAGSIIGKKIGSKVGEQVAKTAVSSLPAVGEMMGEGLHKAAKKAASTLTESIQGNQKRSGSERVASRNDSNPATVTPGLDASRAQPQQRPTPIPEPSPEAISTTKPKPGRRSGA